MSTTADTDAATTLALTEDITAAIASAAGAGKPLVVAYVDAAGNPHLSMRGTVQVLGEDRLGLWSRSPGLPESLAANSRVELLYQNLSERMFFHFSGRGFVEESDELRSRIFDGSPEREQAQDPERNGIAVVIELDSVDGMGPSGPFRLARPDAD